MPVERTRQVTTKIDVGRVFLDQPLEPLDRLTIRGFRLGGRLPCSACTSPRRTRDRSDPHRTNGSSPFCARNCW